VSKQFGFKWRKPKASAHVPKDKSAQARTPEARVQLPPAVKEVPAVPVAAADRSRPSHQRTAVRAYQLWEALGRPEGADLGNWFDAERQLSSEPR
jgi:hypothetical protein